jgi:hypothetical protein
MLLRRRGLELCSIVLGYGSTCTTVLRSISFYVFPPIFLVQYNVQYRCIGIYISVVVRLLPVAWLIYDVLQYKTRSTNTLLPIHFFVTLMADKTVKAPVATCNPVE